jgi:hypothetical protein
MSTIKDIQGLIAKGKTSKALKEVSILIEKHEELEDFTNPIIQLQSRQAQLEESRMLGMADSRDLDVEKNKIINALNFFIGKIEDELPEQVEDEEEEEVIDPKVLLKDEINSLIKKISTLTRKIIHLNNQILIESNPSTKFDLEENLKQVQADKDEASVRLDKLQKELDAHNT